MQYYERFVQYISPSFRFDLNLFFCLFLRSINITTKSFVKFLKFLGMRVENSFFTTIFHIYPIFSPSNSTFLPHIFTHISHMSYRISSYIHRLSISIYRISSNPHKSTHFPTNLHIKVRHGKRYLQNNDQHL